MKISIIDKKGAKLKIENRTLKIDDQKIPLRLIDTLIIASNNNINTKDLIKITKEKINILILSQFAQDGAIITTTTSKNAEIKLAQYKAQIDALKIAKYFITQKITSHAIHLKNHNIEIDINQTIQNIKDTQELQILLGIEGSFSKKYFSQYFKLFPKHLHSGKRTKQPPLDPVNAMLSFLYMLFYNTISIKLISFGFEPSIGYLHKPFRSHNALASDILELFRADINEFVYKCFDKQKLEQSDFSKKQGVYLKYNGRKKIWSDIKIFIDSLDYKIDSEISKLRSIL
jgi:CRISPR-associated protein Cas1